MPTAVEKPPEAVDPAPQARDELPVADPEGTPATSQTCCADAGVAIIAVAKASADAARSDFIRVINISQYTPPDIGGRGR
jgi:nicotinamidase-related amidase